MRRVPVDSSRTKLVRNGSRSISSSSSCAAHRGAILVVDDPRQPHRRGEHAARPDPALERDLQRLLDGHVREQQRVLEAAPEAGRGTLGGRGQVRDVVAGEHDASGVEREEARHEVEDRRLAGAVRSDDADDLALVDVERGAVDGADAAEASDEAVDGERHRPVADGAQPPSADARRSASSARRRWRNTDRSRSGRASRSAVGPLKRIVPRSMK